MQNEKINFRVLHGRTSKIAGVEKKRPNKVY
jgi:hypothetical protein